MPDSNEKLQHIYKRSTPGAASFQFLWLDTHLVEHWTYSFTKHGAIKTTLKVNDTQGNWAAGTGSVWAWWTRVTSTSLPRWRKDALSMWGYFWLRIWLNEYPQGTQNSIIQPMSSIWQLSLCTMKTEKQKNRWRRIKQACYWSIIMIHSVCHTTAEQTWPNYALHIDRVPTSTEWNAKSV